MLHDEAWNKSRCGWLGGSGAGKAQSCCLDVLMSRFNATTKNKDKNHTIPRLDAAKECAR